MGRYLTDQITLEIVVVTVLEPSSPADASFHPAQKWPTFIAVHLLTSDHLFVLMEIKFNEPQMFYKKALCSETT
ncbi:unnamed protein product [Strongylus vulgaris]|uniref:Uncharacterized protein n=1 Tax=Strongylus vulgaris TaxID=40348 RepID=A0A3P7JMG7_STRVU|nr:unnamed protein product [Strongylus vulgaris]